ncbi:MAG: ROK family protein [Clostridia bacterium]|nr:ROK family protein [Clostridia bacterium]
MKYLGIDIGGTSIKASVVDEEMNILSRAKLRTRTGISGQELCDDVVKAAKQSVQEAGIELEYCEYCGVGCPGVVNPKNGRLEYSNNLGQFDVPLRDMLSEMLSMDVYVDNDANCAALGEVVAGAAKGAESALMVTLGTGLGGGIVIGGKIYPGINGVAGEIGHMVICPGGEECTCGRRGCWEAYSSATALKRQTRRAMEASPESLMWKLAPSLDKVRGKTAFDAMRMGDAAATLVVESYIYYLGEGLTNCVNILQPEVVCLGGGVCGEGDSLLIPLREYVEKYRFGRGNIRQPRIVCAQLGNDAGVIGAAMLGR